MGIGSAPTEAIRKRSVVILVLATVLSASAGAQDPQAAEARDSIARDAKQSGRSTGSLKADSTRGSRGADLRQSSSVVPNERTRVGRKLTIRQKRLFVLGLWAAEKN